jgi:superfamily II DNA or RNA helicase
MARRIFANPLVHLYQKSYTLHAECHQSPAHRPRDLHLLFTIFLKKSDYLRMYNFDNSKIPTAVPVLEEVQLKPWFSQTLLNQGLELLKKERITSFHCLRNATGAIVDNNALVTMQFERHTRLLQGFVIRNSYCGMCRDKSSRDGCQHLAALALLSLAAVENGDKPVPLPLIFAGSNWEKLGHFLFDWLKKGGYQPTWNETDTVLRWKAVHANGTITVTIPPAWREQAAMVLPGKPPEFESRSSSKICELLRNQLRVLTMTAAEQTLRDAENTSIGWTRDNSCWMWLARMLFCIHGDKIPALRHLADTFRFTLSLPPSDDLGELHMIIPGAGAWSLVRQLAFTDQDATVLPAGRECSRVDLNGDHELEVVPCVRLTDGRVIPRQDLADTRFIGGYYLPGEGFLPVERLPREGAFLMPEQQSSLPLLGFLHNEADRDAVLRIPTEDIPAFLEFNQSALHHPENIIVAEVVNIEVHRLPDRLEIDDFEERDGWCYLSCRYGLGSTSISLEDILTARNKGLHCLPGDGWLQIDDTPLTWLYDLAESRLADDGSGRIRLRYQEMLALSGVIGQVEVVNKEQQVRRRLTDLLDETSWTNTEILPENPEHLRDYQRNGLAWLTRLYSMGIGGLLADDMGLGKTHQALALLQGAQRHTSDTFCLVICPASVILGWAEKIDRYYTDLDYTIYYGSGRDLNSVGQSGVLLTTYGIVRQDLEILRQRSFNIIIIDEIQHLKNRSTATHKAVAALNGQVVFGLTGTPIENSLGDLYALFHICLPGLLGSERDFKDRYIQPMNNDVDKQAGEMLGRMLKPFILRRTRGQVLKELPEIIEDNRLCELSDDQVALYRQIIDERENVMESLQDESAAIPYMNILAMITRLKQICNHPCLVEGNTDFAKYACGKWDLFVELVEELVDAGMKFVVFSQYTGMLAVIEKYLRQTGIDYCSLEGGMPTTTRQKMIRRFNEDATCRVFVASLLAGGVGIDLTAAQAVIHYDRWWNPAKEEQATARVHRMGQKHVVQSFRLITRGTLEEKIHRLINNKKELAETVIQEDEANIIKRMDRSELAELFQFQPTAS